MRYKKTIYTILAFSLLGMVWHYFFSYHSKTDVYKRQVANIITELEDSENIHYITMPKKGQL